MAKPDFEPKWAFNDFDFVIGNWIVRHRRLKERLVGCTEWVDFEGTSRTQKILGGHGNVEDNFLAFPDGPYRAAAIRSFDSVSGQWSIWWLDQRSPGRLDTPVVGSFSNGKGIFYADDGTIQIRFTWFPKDQGSARWEQAFPPTAGTRGRQTGPWIFPGSTIEPARRSLPLPAPRRGVISNYHAQRLSS